MPYSPRAAKSFHKTLKYFKKLDDFWRDIYYNGRDGMSMVNILERAEVSANVEELDRNLVVINARIDEFCEQQCEAFPRLYFLEKKSILDIFSIVDIELIYSKYHQLLLPFSTKFINHGIERDKTVGISSFYEKVYIPSSRVISSKGDLVDWLKGLFHGVCEKLMYDIQIFHDGKETISTDLRNPRCCDQSRIFYVNCIFWNDLRNFSPSQPDRKLLMKLKMKLNTGLNSYLSLASGFSNEDSYQRVCAANIVMSIINHRDILVAISDAKDADASFVYECAIRVSWDSQQRKGSICQSYLTIPYGNVYQGFGQRMLIAPITHR